MSNSLLADGLHLSCLPTNVRDQADRQLRFRTARTQITRTTVTASYPRKPHRHPRLAEGRLVGFFRLAAAARVPCLPARLSGSRGGSISTLGRLVALSLYATRAKAV